MAKLDPVRPAKSAGTRVVFAKCAERTNADFAASALAPTAEITADRPITLILPASRNDNLSSMTQAPCQSRNAFDPDLGICNDLDAIVSRTAVRNRRPSMIEIAARSGK